MSDNGSSQIIEAVGQIPSGLFVLTAAFDGTRSGVLAKWVQQCSFHPPMVMLAMPKGQPVEPLIRDSRCFALCQVGKDDRILRRKFATTPDRADDPFVTLSMHTAPSGAPIIDHALSYLDCQLVRVIDIEADHLVYVGQVRSAQVMKHSAPAVMYNNDGSVPLEPPIQDNQAPGSIT